jgi:hypothetical protein
LRVAEVGLNIYNRHTRAANRDYLTEIRAEKVRKDTQVAEMRRQKLHNDLVLGDLRIQELNMKLGNHVPREPRPGAEKEGAADWD